MWLHAMDKANPLVVGILRSPLHWLLSPGLMAITVTGHKTGRRFTLPVGYHQQDDAVVIMVSDAPNRTWWRNYREPGPIELRLRGRRVSGVARSLPGDSAAFRLRAEACFSRARFMGRIFGIDFDREKGLDQDQVQRLAEYAAIVEVTPVKSSQPGAGRPPPPA